MKIKYVFGLLIIIIVIVIIVVPTYIYSTQKEKAKWEENVEKYGVYTNSVENVPQDLLDGTRQVLHVGQDINEIDTSKPFSIEVEDSAEKAKIENEQEIQRKREFAQDVMNNPEKYRQTNEESNNSFQEESDLFPTSEYEKVLKRLEEMMYKYYGEEELNRLIKEDEQERLENPYNKNRYKSEEKQLKMFLDLLEGNQITDEERSDIDTFMKREYFNNVEDIELRNRIVRDGYSLNN